MAPLFQSHHGSPHQPQPFTTVMIVPTGVGASIGGFAGDATQAMHLLAAVSDRLITHPNVANAAVFQKLPANAWYVEGYALDACLQGRWALRATNKRHRIGVVLDAGIPKDMEILTRNTLNAVTSIYGVPIAGIETTTEPVSLAFETLDSGASSGQISNPHVVIEAAQRLMNQGATAIALAVFFPEAEALGLADAEANYKAGSGVDPIGGLEALLSHTVVKALGVPSAHAPVLSYEASEPETKTILDPRVAPEFIAHTFVPCVLTGLMQAPQFITDSRFFQPSDVTAQSIHAVVVPADCLGGPGVLAAIQQGIPVIAVASNTTWLSVTPESMGHLPTVRTVANYEEAVGVLVSLRLN
ncbi:MAG: DUF3326 domain-containing protein [Vampirovibrionales bacterium]|nr:DUF3326 domain-containing protein [Vampirovibrionales bacterium]